MKQNYTRTVCCVILAVCLVCMLCGCDRGVSGSPVLFDAADGAIVIRGEDGSLYGFLCDENTRLVWSDPELAEKYADRGYKEWDFLCGADRLTVRPGREADRPEQFCDTYVSETEGIRTWRYAVELHVAEMNAEEPTDAKPVIYLYPEREQAVTVRLDYDGRLTCTYPASRGTWTVTARPDGWLTDESGTEYRYLYWEGQSEEAYDFSEGFCVAGKETAQFLEEALAALGLDRAEANEMIVFWLPQMERNAWNLISFQGASYTNRARLHITPTPDTLIRVFMAWQPLDEPVELPAQKLAHPEREGFTVVEWGGCKVLPER